MEITLTSDEHDLAKSILEDIICNTKTNFIEEKLKKSTDTMSSHKKVLFLKHLSYLFLGVAALKDSLYSENEIERASKSRKVCIKLIDEAKIERDNAFPD